jgi:small subunit ribosomal protein S16
MEFRFFDPFLAISLYTLRRTEMIKIRLQRHGARHAPFYRMVVAPSTSRRDGRFIEVLGTYNPQAHARSEELKLKMERVDHWLQVGAQPTDTAKSLIKQGRLSPEEWLERAEKKTKAKAERTKKKNAPVVEDSAPVEDAKAEDAPAEASAEEAVPEAKEAPVEETKEEKKETPKEDPVAEESKDDKESEA